MKISEILNEACWKGYHKEGNKKMFGKTYPNCVKNEDVVESSEEKDNLVSTLNSFGYYTEDSHVYVNDNGDKIVRVGSEWKHQSGKRGRGAEELSYFLSSKRNMAEGGFDIPEIPRAPQPRPQPKEKTSEDASKYMDTKPSSVTAKQADELGAMARKAFRPDLNPDYYKDDEPVRPRRNWDYSDPDVRPIVNQWMQKNLIDKKPMTYQQGVDEGSLLDEDWQKVNRRDKTSGLSRKAVKAYRREHPGSKLQTAVTTKPSKLKKGSKSAKRRKSFCARMSGMKKAHAGAKTKRDPNSPINKALRRWNCESIEEMRQLIEYAQIEIAKDRARLEEGTASGDHSLHDWFSKSKSSDGKPGWVQIGGRYAGKPCAKQPGQKTKPKCGSSKMKRSMSKKEEEAAARRKRREDPNPNRSGQAKNVNTNPKRKVKEQNVPQEVGSPQSNTPSNPLSMGISALRMLNSLRNVDPKTAIQNIVSQELSNQARSDQDASSNNLKIIRRP